MLLIKNNLFGSFVNNALVFAPIELVGFIMWGRNLDENRNVKPKKTHAEQAYTCYERLYC